MKIIFMSHSLPKSRVFENTFNYRLNLSHELHWSILINPPGIHLIKANIENIRPWMRSVLKWPIKTPEWRRRRSDIFIVNSEQISHITLMFSLQTCQWNPRDRARAGRNAGKSICSAIDHANTANFIENRESFIFSQDRDMFLNFC